MRAAYVDFVVVESGGTAVVGGGYLPISGRTVRRKTSEFPKTDARGAPTSVRIETEPFVR